jgi:hypothetical protein
MVTPYLSKIMKVETFSEILKLMYSDAAHCMEEFHAEIQLLFIAIYTMKHNRFSNYLKKLRTTAMSVILVYLEHHSVLKLGFEAGMNNYFYSEAIW